jgi:hypothetical protein
VDSLDAGSAAFEPVTLAAPAAVADALVAAFDVSIVELPAALPITSSMRVPRSSFTS